MHPCILANSLSDASVSMVEEIRYDMHLDITDAAGSRDASVAE